MSPDRRPRMESMDTKSDGPSSSQKRDTKKVKKERHGGAGAVPRTTGSGCGHEHNLRPRKSGRVRTQQYTRGDNKLETQASCTECSAAASFRSSRWMTWRPWPSRRHICARPCCGRALNEFGTSGALKLGEGRCIDHVAQFVVSVQQPAISPIGLSSCGGHANVCNRPADLAAGGSSKIRWRTFSGYVGLPSG